MNIPSKSALSKFLAMGSEEPYRLCFPLGLLAAMAGLSLWPLFFWNIWPGYPSIVHARFMVEGFLAAFIFGFLGTAGPRLMTAPHWTVPELLLLLALHSAVLAAHLTGHIIAGDNLFLVLSVSFVLVLAKRFVAREDLPPPNFVLVACGVLSGIAGTAIMQLGIVAAPFARFYTFGSLLLNQGFVLFPVLGVGVFLFPRLLGIPFGEELKSIRVPGSQWKRKALIAAGTALVIIVSFAMESAGHVREAGLLRFLAAILYVASQIPEVLGIGRSPCLGWCVRVSIWLLLAGLLWQGILPTYRIAGLHIVFIGGFMFVTLTVATRVVLGHSGQNHRFQRPIPFLIWTGVLLAIGLLARVAAEFVPGLPGRNAHLIYAALLCVAGALVWGCSLARFLFVSDTDSSHP